MKFRKIFLTTTFASVLSFSPARAQIAQDGTFADAVKAYEDYDYDTALDVFAPLAEAGDPKALFYMGKMYEDGDGVKESRKKAIASYEAAIAAGSDDAKVALGLMYVYTKKKRVDHEKAFNLFKEASDNDHAAGRLFLAEMYEWGRHVEQDRQMAVNLYAQVTRMEKFPEERFTYAGYWDAVKRVRNIAEVHGLRETFTPEQLAEQDAEEDRRQQALAEQAVLREKLRAEQKARDEAEALRIQQAVAAAGPIERGWMAYEAGNFVEAIPVLLAHADNGDKRAQTVMGQLYRDGIGVAQDDAEARMWFLKADTPEAKYNRAIMAYEYRSPKPDQFYSHEAYGWDLMEQSAIFGYQPAVDFIDRANAAKAARIAEKEAQEQARLAAIAEEEARKAEHRRKYGRKTITNCDGPRPGDAPPVPEGYYCDRTPGSLTYGAYVRKR